MNNFVARVYAIRDHNRIAREEGGEGGWRVRGTITPALGVACFNLPNAAEATPMTDEGKTSTLLQTVLFYALADLTGVCLVGLRSFGGV